MESALLELESTRLSSDRIKAEQKRVVLEQDARCSHCGRSISPNSAIAITPNRDVYHYGCLSDASY
jgi:hypothetical protein